MIVNDGKAVSESLDDLLGVAAAAIFDDDHAAQRGRQLTRGQRFERAGQKGTAFASRNDDGNGTVHGMVALASWKSGRLKGGSDSIMAIDRCVEFCGELTGELPTFETLDESGIHGARRVTAFP